MQTSDTFEFLDETDIPSATLQTPLKKWKVLSVEDNPDYQQALVASLKSLHLPLGTSLEIITANSAFEAVNQLNTHKDIGLILLDVVMEEDDSGLRLVGTIRQELANSLVRIVLLTGQPGFAPEKDVMSALDIDEYWNKAELRQEKLQSIVNSNLRTWSYISDLAEARHGLQIVLDAARTINSRYDLPSFTRAVLAEIGHIIGVKKGGLFCMGNCHDPFKESQILTATGCFSGYEGLALTDNQLTELLGDMTQALANKCHIIGNILSVFYFETQDINEKCYLIVVNCETALSEAHINLLKVFSENISSGFTNIALLNKVTELAYTHVDLNIPNRNWLTKEIQNMTRQEWSQTRLLMLEVKHFDEMKFTFGYEFIQNVLSYVYQNLKKMLPKGTRITLSGHKQFSILIDRNFAVTPQLIEQLTYNEIEVEGVAHVSSFALLNMLLEEHKQTSAARIISLAESVLKEASHKNIVYVEHSLSESEKIQRRYSLMAELRNAIRERQLSVALQPKINLSDGKVSGFEALARWQRNDGSFVRPDEFVAIAETSGLIVPLDCLIFEKSLEALQLLYNKGYRIPVAFNASSYDLLHPDYLNNIKTCLAKSELPAELLELEVTETQAIADYERIKRCLQNFASLGMKISIDDFGTGYSSLAHISNLSAQSIKIDRSFVSKLESDKNSEHVINMILSLGRKFNFSIVAEGVETEYQKQWLSQVGCDIGQGYLFAKPMFIHELVEWLGAHNPL